MTKYHEYFNKMIDENKDVFDEFKTLHQSYLLDETKWQMEFNDKGAKIMEIVRDYENRLCSNTERGMYNKFSGGLSEKFQALVRKEFPSIDNVGLIVEEKVDHSSFNIKKISL